MILLFCNVFVFFKFILCPLVLMCRALIHNQVKIWVSMNINMCQKPPLHWYVLSIVSFKRMVTSYSFLIYSRELFPMKPNSIMWFCLHRKLAWFIGLLCNWRQLIHLEMRASFRSRWSISSRQSRCWKGIRFIPKPRLGWIYHYATWYPRQLCG